MVNDGSLQLQYIMYIEVVDYRIYIRSVSVYEGQTESF